MLYTVRQIRIGREMSDAINTLGSWTEAENKYPLVRAYLAASHSAGNKVTADMLLHWAPVATIEADSLDEVFEIGNMGPEERITRLAPMHSISVGDIIVDENGLGYIVRPYGWALITDKGEFVLEPESETDSEFD